VQIIENNKIQEKVYIEKQENGLTVMVFPRKNIQKKYIIWGTNFGSIDNHFITPGDTEETIVPDGIAHYLEHKLFEQENGKNSLDVLSSLGVDANAYTGNNMTAYLYECSDNFYEALDEFMNYVQNPYFTDENVEKERGIIGQEISMYDDYPEWKLYMNAMKCMYSKNPINIDVAGTKETISHINKENLYKIYNTFYRLDNMVLVVCGDFNVDEILCEIKNRITLPRNKAEIKRIYPVEPEEIAKKQLEAKMEISMPCFMVAYKDKVEKEKFAKKDLAMDIIFYIILGKSSKLYQKLYNEGLIYSELAYDYEFSKTYSHFLIQGQSTNPEKVIEEIKNEIEKFKKTGLDEEEFKRAKKKIYGEYVKEYNNISVIANDLLTDYMKGIAPFIYFEEFDSLTKEDVEENLKEVLVEDKRVTSIVWPLDK
jgi:predicted Zn-dependent peptidase